ncbi:hypothetical protein LTR47_003741 [Exophiala xenobiotica]|nr:hypothetical protein LTR41_002054 [Exophiala xenobiotica]KAK5234906.1 hypothetical protein LTR47_003741 [Exophiala xenobiotica]KAK5251909.1 hypothetical protein LTS06_003421 [Exophiala xenobiotica]KAK5282722.1 hypothetical protein LTR40_002857 [Exophiala xenobiotica]KAK5346827.1 hypothetical protein LTR61_009523 [Exophiala xenobiotica]
MIPITALIILSIVVAVASITFLIAIYCSISNSLETRKAKRNNAENDMTLPLTEDSADPANLSQSEPPARPVTPEAEYPPPLPDDLASFLETVESPPPLPAETRDSMHEIIHLYTNEARNLRPPPKSAPATVATFAQADSVPRTKPTFVPGKSAPPSIMTSAQAESKWAYFGQKRAENNMV